MNYKIIDIFPMAVMKFNFENELNELELDFINKCEKTSVKNSGNSNSSNSYIFEDSAMHRIKAFSDKCLNTYFENIYSPAANSKLKITQSWINYTNLNEYHHPHAHTNSIVSGVFYVSANKELDKITFAKNNYQQIEIEYKEANDYNTNELDIKVGTNELILFPSSLLHYVPPTTNKNKRISIAFNSFVEGNIGIDFKLNKLKL
jgi:uncharacterized protein (TIGR02466 family)